MYKINIVILISIIFITGCFESKKPVIKLGKIFNNKKLEVSGDTNIFTRNNNFAYTLSQDESFDTNIITRRFYKGKVYIDMIRVESVDIKIKPDTKKIGESIPVREIIQRYGGGDYMILFIINDSVIAKKSFSIEGPTFRVAKPMESQVHVNEEILPKRTDENIPLSQIETIKDISKSDKKIVSPSEIMKDRSNDEIMPKKANKDMLSPSEMMKDMSKE